MLWSPNNKMIPVTVSFSGGVVTFVLRTATSNEPNTGPGPDIDGFVIGTADAQGLLRASRNGKETARIYTLTYDVQGQGGSAGSCVVRVTVPHDQRP